MWKQGVSSFLIVKTPKHSLFLWLDIKYIWDMNYKYEDLPANAVFCYVAAQVLHCVQSMISHSLPVTQT